MYLHYSTLSLSLSLSLSLVVFLANLPLTHIHRSSKFKHFMIPNTYYKNDNGYAALSMSLSLLLVYKQARTCQ